MDEPMFSVGQHLYITGDEWAGQYGTIVKTWYDGERDLYEVRLDNSNEDVVVCESDMEDEDSAGE